MEPCSASQSPFPDGVNPTPFRLNAQAWIDHKVAVIPLAGKKPLVKRPDRFGIRASLKLVNRPRFAAANLGFWGGKRNGLTVVDIDAPGDDAIAAAIERYGDTPLKVRTASGKAHLYFRYAGERRSIRPIEGEPIDILGDGGLIVAPPSSVATAVRE